MRLAARSAAACRALRVADRRRFSVLLLTFLAALGFSKSHINEKAGNNKANGISLRPLGSRVIIAQQHQICSHRQNNLPPDTFFSRIDRQCNFWTLNKFETRDCFQNNIININQLRSRVSTLIPFENKNSGS